MASTSDTRKNYYGRKPRRKKFSNQEKKMYSIAKKAVADAEKVDEELKRHSIASSIDVDAAGAILNISNVSVGNTASTRIGEEINLKNLFIRYTVEKSPDLSAGRANFIRLIIFRWNNDGTPITTDIIPFSGSGNYWLDALNTNYSQQIQVLHDQLLVLDENQTAQADKLFIKLRGKSHYTTAAAQQHGNIYAFLVSNAPGGLTDKCQFSYYMRLRFTDS